jgi:hypothetical protein
VQEREKENYLDDYVGRERESVKKKNFDDWDNLN